MTHPSPTWPGLSLNWAHVLLESSFLLSVESTSKELLSSKSVAEATRLVRCLHMSVLDAVANRIETDLAPFRNLTQHSIAQQAFCPCRSHAKMYKAHPQVSLTQLSIERCDSLCSGGGPSSVCYALVTCKSRFNAKHKQKPSPYVNELIHERDTILVK